MTHLLVKKLFGKKSGALVFISLLKFHTPILASQKYFFAKNLIFPERVKFCLSIVTLFQKIEQEIAEMSG